MRNRVCEVVIVPEIGRVMRFDLIDGQGSLVAGPLWNNPALGKDMPPDAEGWRNFGGDKAWPAPQADWPRVVGRAWPPPDGFDSAAFTARIRPRQVELTSPVDSIYGIRVRRVIAVDANQPVLTVRTTYEKLQGPAVRVAVWTITQLAPPERAFILMPQRSALPQGYVSLLATPPNDLKINGRLLSLTRGTRERAKIGSDGKAILWVGAGPDLLLESTAPEVRNPAEWPEQGSRTEIYTNSGDQVRYVEFELMQKLQALKPGEKTSLQATYSLIPRQKTDPIDEAERVFHPD